MNNTSFKDKKLNTRKVVYAQKRFEIERENLKHYHQEKKKVLKETKNLLIISFISIIFCLIALTGTTYAWFTSTVSNSNNRIQAGNLEVELLAQDVDSGQIIDLSDDEANVFDIESLIPGEPVQTILTIKNKGTVDLRFAVFFDIQQDSDPMLSDKLKVYVKEYHENDNIIPIINIGTMADFAGTRGFISDNLSLGTSKTYRIWIDLDSSLANLETYQGKQIEFDIRLSAKQVEDMSTWTIDNQY